MDKKKLASDLEQGSAVLALIEPATGGLMSMVGSVLNKAIFAAERKRQIWWQYVVENKTDEEFERTLEYELNEEHGDVILEGLRAAIGTVDNAALPPLGWLTRTYLLTKTGARDRFFRCCTRLLCDISADELDQIKRLVVWSLNVVERDEFDLVQKGAHVFVVKDEHVNEQPDKAGIHAIMSDFNASHVFDLLADYALLRPTMGNYLGNDPPNIRATRTVFMKLHRILTGHEVEPT